MELHFIKLSLELTHFMCFLLFPLADARRKHLRGFIGIEIRIFLTQLKLVIRTACPECLVAFKGTAKDIGHRRNLRIVLAAPTESSHSRVLASLDLGVDVQVLKLLLHGQAIDRRFVKCVSGGLG